MTRPIPEGWQEASLGSVIRVVDVRTTSNDEYPALTSARSGLTYQDNYFNKRMTSKDNTGYKILRRGQFTYRAMSDDGMFRFNQLDFCDAGIVSPAYDVFEADGCNPDFLRALLNSSIMHQGLNANAQGGTRLTLKVRGLSSLPILLPPLPEQQKIAEILGSVDATIEATRSVITQTRRTQKVLMEELLTKGLPGRHTKFKKTPWGTAPKDWEIMTIGDLFEIQLGKMLSQKAKEGINPKPYLANYNVRWNGVDISKIQYMDFSEREMTKFRLRKGDLLVCEGGEIGRCAIWEETISECYYQKALHRLRPRSNEILPQFIVYFMQNASNNGYFSDYSGVNTIAHLTAEKLTLLKVPLPPVEEQESISILITQVDDSTKKHNEYLNGLENLKSALTQVLLCGDKRVFLKQPEGMAV